MADYDDRPISVYDNLNTMNAMPAPATSITTTTAKPTMHTSTPKAKTSNNGAGFPYDDEMTFKLRDKTKNRQQQQLQNLLPNGQSQTHQNQRQQQQQASSALPQIQFALNQPGDVALYSMPVKPLIAQATTTTTTNTLATPAAAALATGQQQHNNPAASQRPLSQHSLSELNEASQSIAAIKAALNDAKSKFFGLNGYAQDTHDAPIASTNGVPTYNLLNNNNNNNNNNSNNTITFEQHRPKVQIISPARSQPKYQNIPENSAIYRQQQHEDQPPALPPKPAIYNDQRQKSSSPESQHLMATSSPATSATSATPSPHSERNSSNTITPSQQTPQMVQNLPYSATPYDLSNSAPAQSGPAGTSPVAYKQLPLSDLDLGPQPSQAVYMSTTVPQNIKGSKIAGRHTPTRNSLRHSRMLVVNNKNYQGVQHPNPMNFKYPTLARWLLILQTLLGVLLIFLAIWIFFLAPNAKIQDNPYWSGLALLLAGSIGLVLVRFPRIKRHKARENCFHFLRADSYLLSLVAVLLCGVALTCAAFHFARLSASDTRCVSSNILLEHGSCVCTFNAGRVDNNATANGNGVGWLDEGPGNGDLEAKDESSYTVEYRDLSCQEVTGEWIFLLSASMVLNALGLIVSLLFLTLLICCRTNSKRLYSSVHTSTF